MVYKLEFLILTNYSRRGLKNSAAFPRFTCLFCSSCDTLSTFTRISENKSSTATRGAARNFVRERPFTDVVRFQTLAILHKDHFDVTGQFMVYYNRIWRQISSTSRHR